MPRVSKLDRTGNFTRLSSSNIIGRTTTARATRRASKNTKAGIEAPPGSVAEVTAETEVPGIGRHPDTQQHRYRSATTTPKTRRGSKETAASTEAAIEEVVESQVPPIRGQPPSPRQRRRSADISSDNVIGPPDSPQNRTRRGAMCSQPTVKRTASKRKEARHDPMTTKGRSAFKRVGNPTIPETGGSLIPGDEEPGISKKKEPFAVRLIPAEARDLLGKVRRMSGETSQIAEKASAARFDPEVTDTDDEEVEMDIDLPSSDEEKYSEDKENQRPITHCGSGPGHAANGIIIFEDTPEAESPGPYEPLGELPNSRPLQDDPNSASETNDFGSSYVVFVENRRRAAVGQPPLNRSPLSQPPLVQSTTEQELSDPFAPATPPPAATSPSTAPHSPSLGMRIRCYPLSRRPPLEGSDLTLPLPETASSPSIVVHPPSDEEESSPDWSPTHLSNIKPREEPYQRRGRSASLSPRTDRKGRYRKDDKSSKGKGKEHRGKTLAPEVTLG